MKKNTGSIDRVLRVTLGIGLLAITQIGPKTPWGFIGIVPLLTAAISFCPIYPLLGINTCPTKK